MMGTYVIIACVAGAIGLGCGGDDGQETEGVPAEFIQRADGICEQFAGRRGSPNQPEGHYPELLVPLLRQSLEQQRRLIAAFRDLEPPPGYEEQTAALTSKLREFDAVVRGRVLPAAKAGDVQAVKGASAELERIADELAAQFRDLGFRTCASTVPVIL
jgi:hypothetical protein